MKIPVVVPLIYFVGLALMAACSGGSQASPVPAATPATAAAPLNAGTQPVNLSLPNHGGGMEGHTPRGFQGMGTGLFAGDNLNRSFPDGDGVQIFLTFDLSELPPGEVLSAILSSEHASVTGRPFKDLGSLTAEEVRYAGFTSALWNLRAVENGARCILSDSASGPFRCDLAEAVQRSLEDSYRYAQFRVRFDQAGDGDGSQDMIAFFIRDSNTNEPGIFRLDVAIIPD